MNIKNVVISLERSPARYKDFQKIFPRDHQRYIGFDGQEIFKTGLRNQVNSTLIDKFKQSKCCPYTHIPGVLGCWRSHLGVWHQLVHDNEYDAYLIMEDDLSITGSFFHVLDLVRENLPSTFDICYLGGRFRKDFMPKRTPQWTSMDLGGGLIVHLADPKGYGYDFDRGLFCYVLTKQGATKLIDYFVEDLLNPEKHMGAVDEWIYRNRGRYNICEVIPHVSWSVPGVRSDIR